MTYQPPQTRVFTEFADSAAVTASELSACLIGPYYDVHDTVRLGAYNSTAAVYPYIGLSGDDTIDSSDMASVFSCVLKNAQVQGYRPITYSSTANTAGYIGGDGKSLITGMTVANGGGTSVPAGFPALSIGDTVIQKDDEGAIKSTNTIAGFLPYNALSYGIGLPIFDTSVEHSSADITLDGTHTYASDALLVFTITAGGKIGTDTVKASLSINGGAAIKTEITCGTSAVTLSGADGLSTLTIAFTSNVTWTTGDRISFPISTPTNYSSQSNMGYGVIVLSSAVTAAAGDTFTLYYSAGDIVNPNGATFTPEGLSASASLSKGGLSLYSGTLYATYRVRKNLYTDRVYTVGTTGELEGLLGSIHPLNPLSMMCYLAIINSNNSYVTFVAVADDTLASYSKAFDVAGTNTNAWALVPYSQDVAVQQLAFAKAKEYCSAEVMNWKTAWLGYDTENITTVMSTIAGTVTSGSANKLVISDTNTYDITVVRAGDILTYNDNKYTVTSVFTAVASPYLLLSGDLPVGNIAGASILRNISAVTKVEEVKAYAASFNSELVRVFYGDNPFLTAYPGDACPMSYVAAAWAGKRSGVPPHQGLTRSTINGIAFAGGTGFTESELNEMASGGVWLTITDTRDGNTYCRHQLTTKSQTENYNLKEDSKVSNAHEICMTIRSAMDVYYGRANVVDAALEVIRLKALNTVTAIQSRSWSELLGPQIVELASLTVERDANYSDRVNVRAELSTPDPLNNLDVYLVIR